MPRYAPLNAGAKRWPFRKRWNRRAKQTRIRRNMLPSRYFVELTQPEIAEQLRKNPLVIFPAGSVEQHGPHLPTGTDIFATNVIAHAVAERMRRLVLPGGALGVTRLYMPFEGTITLTAETFMRVVTETAASTAQH